MEKIVPITPENFNEWNIQKQFLNEKKPYRVDKDEKKIPRKPIREGEIWWCKLGVNIGQEIYGKGPQFTRPVLVIKKISGYSCIVIPITSETKDGTWFYPIDLKGTASYLIFPQIRNISTARFTDRIVSLQEKEFIKIRQEAGKYYGFI